MSEEDTELRDLISQTLEQNGVLPRIRAELRASVFLALEEHDSKHGNQNRNKDLHEYLKTHNGKLVFSLVKNFLQHFNLEKTLLVLEPEVGTTTNVLETSDLSKELSLTDDQKSAVLSRLVEKTLNAEAQLGPTKTQPLHNSKAAKPSSLSLNSEDDVTNNSEELSSSKGSRKSGFMNGNATDGSLSRSSSHLGSAHGGSRIPKLKNAYSPTSSGDKKWGTASSMAPLHKSHAPNLSSLKDLPSLDDGDRGHRNTLTKSNSGHQETAKKMKDFGFDDFDDFDYQDDFDDSMKSSSLHKSAGGRGLSGKPGHLNNVGRDASHSIEEEIDEVLDVDDDDFFNPQSGIDDVTTDRTIDSDRSLGVDYVEEFLKKH